VPRGLVALVVAGAGVAVGLFTLQVVAREPALSFAGASLPGRLALLGTGWALVACGLAYWLSRPGSHFGPLLAAAGIAWFLLEWATPATDSSLAFTAGLVLAASCPPVAAHAVLTFEHGRLSGLVERAAVAFGYVASVLVLGLLPTLVFDPSKELCNACPSNLLAVTDRSSAVTRLHHLGLWTSAASAIVLALVAAAAVVRSSPAGRRVIWPVLGAGSIYLALVAWLEAASLDRGVLWNGSTERWLWRAQALALLGVVGGVAWGRLRARRRRAAVARLVLRLAHSPPPGGLRGALADIVGDPALQLAYPREGSGRLVDAEGRSVELPEELQQTTLVAGQRRLAVLAHRPGVLDDEHLVGAVTDAARLVLENERLQAEARARLDELRRSRARIVEAGDAERRRLERDLHDGAQQRLVGFALSLRLLRSQLSTELGPAAASELREAEGDLQNAIESLRTLAHGIFPAVLADGGLDAALLSLAEEATVPIRIDGASGDRFTPGVEAAAYLVVVKVAAAARGGVAVRAMRRDGSLVVDIDAHGLHEPFDRTALEDRVGAENGQLTIAEQNGGTSVHAEFPCAS